VGIEIGQGAASAAVARPSVCAAAMRGLARRCPACGRGPSLRGYLKVRESCPGCGERLGHIRADDFPPYATIFLVGHLVIPMVLLVEQRWSPELLPYVKGAVLGLMWALGLSGDERQ
jgi:uncharacterized protein (DUF983 family)